ncbi:YqgE/AlgH family protein [Arenibaculum pallidiluteum]|uniref:YqgE/AlgH family protein n=1 Tax=Arenibaculum pallidiluteum TaxID=2812559 RepID=UPI001A96430E|nr:YqgE/AlgH family protein [Arenibaculum pallidiluteum]
MTYVSQNPDTLAGHLLIAMPGMPDPRFARSVIYLCAHGEEGAMGIVVNRLMDAITFHELLDQLEIEPPGIVPTVRVHFGGPVEQARGFVLHSTDFVREGSLVIDDEVALTATVDILRAIAEGRGPKHRLFALGYAGWGPGQLDAEIQANGWLNVPADAALLFDEELETKWERAIAKIGAHPAMLSGEAGHA